MVEAMTVVVIVCGAPWTVFCLLVGYQVGARGGRPIGMLDEIGRAAGRVVRGESERMAREEGKAKDESKRMKV